MFDSIRYKIPLPRKECLRLSKYSQLYWRYDNTTSDLYKKQSDSRRRKLYIGSEFYDANLYILPSFSKVFLDFSIPKVIFGNNVQECSLQGLEEATGVVFDFLRKEVPSIPDFHSWEIIRLDLCRRFRYPNDDTALDILTVLKAVSFANFSKWEEDTTVAWRKSRNSYRLQFYLKHPQFLADTTSAGYKKLKRNGHLDFAERIRSNSLGVLRFEVELNQRALSKHFGKFVNISSVLSVNVPSIIDRYLKFVLDFVKPEMTRLIKVKDNLVGKFGSTKGNHLFQFYYLYYGSGKFIRDITKQSYSKSQLYQLKRDVNKVITTTNSENLLIPDHT